MQRARPLLLVFAGALALSSCGSSATTNVTGPTATRCQMSVTNSGSSFAAAGGAGTVSISVARECSWSATTQAAWIQLAATHDGQGDGSVDYRVSSNADPVVRRGSIVIGDQRADISQDAAPCQFDVSGPAAPFDAAGGRAAVDVRTNAVCAWTAVSDASWLSVSPASGTGNATISVAAQPNRGAERTVTLTVAGDRLTLRQSAARAPAPAPTPEPAPPPPPTPTPTPTPTPPPTPTPTPTPIPTPTTITISGKTSHLSGTCPSVQFVVSDQRVQTSTTTAWKGGSCKDLKNKMNVTVQGIALDSGVIAAQTVTLDR